MAHASVAQRIEHGLPFPAIGREARKAAQVLALVPAEQKAQALRAAAAAVRAHKTKLLQINSGDRLAAKRSGRPASFIDRLTLTEGRIESMARGLEDIAALP